MYNFVSILFNFFVNSAENCSLLSNIALSSNLCNFYILFLNNLANLSADVPSIVTTHIKITNRPLSKLKSEVSYRDYKRTWQGVTDELLSYLYDTYMVHANNK